MTSLYQQLNYSPTHAYKLIQLPPDVVSYMKDNPQGQLLVKSPSTDKKSANTTNNLVVCTDNKTWKLRQMNKLSTVLVFDDLSVSGRSMNFYPGTDTDVGARMVGISQNSYEYELTETKGTLDVSYLPKYSPESLDTINPTITMKQLMEDSTISTGEFYRQWYDACGCEIDGYAYVLSTTFVTELLTLLIVTTLSEDLKVFHAAKVFNVLASESHVTKEMVDTILNKFCKCIDNESEDPEFSLDDLKISIWFGVRQLEDRGSALPQKDFLLYWKQLLPQFYNVPLDMANLRGFYYRPMENYVQFLLESSLLLNLSMRFNQMFMLAKSWNYDEFVPYISEFIPKGKTADAVILKHGKKKRMGKGFIVTSR